MTEKDLNYYLSVFRQLQNKILTEKGHDYSTTDDRLINFKRIAAQTGLTPQQVWLVYITKHFDALRRWAVEGVNESDPLDERFVDLANYAFLGYLLWKESEFHRQFVFSSLSANEEKSERMVEHGPT